MKRVLLITGNEICHNFFANYLAVHCPEYIFDVLKHHSGKSDFEYFYPIYSVGAETQEEKTSIVRFIANRNICFALNEEYALLRSPDSCAMARSMDDFNQLLDERMSQNSYAYVFSYGAPLISHPKILALNSSAFNIHCGLSRFYRGGDSNILALSKGEFDKVGLTCHELRKEVDGGCVLFEIDQLSFKAIRTIDELNYTLIRRACEKIANVIQNGIQTMTEIEKGTMFFNRDMHCRLVIDAEKNLKKVSAHKEEL